MINANAYVQDDRWRRYGLSALWSSILLDAPLYTAHTFLIHDAVCDYLDAHPDVAERFLRKEEGSLYFDIVRRAVGIKYMRFVWSLSA
jgi:hypothetical protein